MADGNVAFDTQPPPPGPASGPGREQSGAPLARDATTHMSGGPPPRPTVNQYPCPNCDMQFKNISLMKRHLATLCVGGDTAVPPQVPPTPENFPNRERSSYMYDPPERDPGPYAPLARSARSLPGLTGDQSEPAAIEDLTRSRTHGHLGMDEANIAEEIRRLHAELTGGGDQASTVAPRESFSPASSERLTTERTAPQPSAPKPRTPAPTAHDPPRSDSISRKARELEEQKEDILRRLEDLRVDSNRAQGHLLAVDSVGDRGDEDDTLQAFLDAIKRQDDTLQNALKEIREEIRQLKQHNNQQQHFRPAPNAMVPIIPYQPRNAASTVNALKSGYLQAGGHDPGLLSQINYTIDSALDQQVSLAKPARPAAPNDQYQTLRLLEYEKANRRLEEELALLRVGRRREPVESEMARMQREHQLKMMHMQQEIEQLRQEHYLKQMRDQLNPPKPVQMQRYQEPPHLMKDATDSGLDNLGAGPYDPTAGFVIFYDFMLNIDPSYDKIGLIVGLYNGPHEVCSAKHLSLTDCLGQDPMQSIDPLNHQLLFSLISVSQPVQRCRPGPDLSLVVEVQASSVHMPHTTTIGWTKLLLFDHQLRVLSGRWRSPIRIKPVRPELIPKQLNTIPQCGTMEMYYRIANFRDADVQSTVKISPFNARQYKYPPSAVAHPVYYQPPAAARGRVTQGDDPPRNDVNQIRLPVSNPNDTNGPPPPPSSRDKSPKIPKRPTPTRPARATPPASGSANADSSLPPPPSDNPPESSGTGSKKGSPAKKN